MNNRDAESLTYQRLVCGVRKIPISFSETASLYLRFTVQHHLLLLSLTMLTFGKRMEFVLTQPKKAKSEGLATLEALAVCCTLPSPTPVLCTLLLTTLHSGVCPCVLQKQIQTLCWLECEEFCFPVFLLSPFVLCIWEGPTISYNQARFPVERLGHQPSQKTLHLQFVLPTDVLG